MPEKWTGSLVGRMHNERVSYAELGAELGFGKAYVCLILNGRRNPKDIESRMEKAFEAVLAKRNNQ